MTKVAALELGARSMRVNSVRPGMIGTKVVSEVAGADVDVSWVGKKVALGRVSRADEIAPLLVFLASDESWHCTGSEFVADGERRLRMR